MAEIAAVTGLVASIVQLVDFATKIIERLNDFHRIGREAPKTFRNLKIELPLLCEALQHIDRKIDAGFIQDGSRTAILSVVNDCWKQVKELNTIITKILPTDGDSARTRVKKTVASLRQEAKVKHIAETLHGYITTLTLYHAVAAPIPRLLMGTASSMLRSNPY